MNPLQAMEKCIEHLRQAYTPKGAVDWFDRPRAQLNWRTPLEAIREGKVDEVLFLAEASRSSDAT